MYNTATTHQPTKREASQEALRIEMATRRGPQGIFTDDLVLAQGMRSFCPASEPDSSPPFLPPSVNFNAWRMQAESRRLALWRGPLIAVTRILRRMRIPS